MRKRKKKSNWLRLLLLHRYTGLTAAFFAILLSITGILLNHTQELALNKNYASASWLMQMYGIKTPDISQAYTVEIHKKMHWVMAFDGGAYLDQHALKCNVPLVGALYANDMLLIANATQLCLFTAKGEMIDVLSLGNKQTIKRIGQQQGQSNDKALIIDSSTGLFTVNAEYTALLAGDASLSLVNTLWSKPSVAPDAVIAPLLKQHKGEGLPWERVVLDLHSGRIVGLAGVYFMDVIALLLIFLSLSGLALWAKRTFFKRKNG
ncbi:MAG TPA: PepSY domain-containing protein [Thiothrix sp.]|nr:PepSY domain-containing protein [Thiothrix sp.]